MEACDHGGVDTPEVRGEMVCGRDQCIQELSGGCLYRKPASGQLPESQEKGQLWFMHPRTSKRAGRFYQNPERHGEKKLLHYSIRYVLSEAGAKNFQNKVLKTQ